MSDLITILEKAAGPDRLIDAHIHGFIKPERLTARHYTASVDDALTLVPDGWWIKMESKGAYYHAELEYVGPSCADDADFLDDVCAHNKPTLAIAICLAALKARFGAGVQSSTGAVK